MQNDVSSSQELCITTPLMNGEEPYTKLTTQNSKNPKLTLFEVEVTSHQVKRGKRKSDFSPSTEKRVVAMYLEGENATTIATQLGLGYSNVRTLLKRANVQILSPSERGKRTRYQKQRTCRHCNDSFVIMNAAQVYCRTCCPTKRAYQRLKHYKLSQPEFESLWKLQLGKCALCLRKLIDGGSTNLNVDHCHKTGQIRGLLCHRCNIVVGFMDKEPLSNQFSRLKLYLNE